MPCCVRVAPRVVSACRSNRSERWRVAAADDFDFCPSRRLRSAAEFSAVFSWRRVLRGGLFDLHYRPASGPSARLGLVIAKKQARRAVVRNAIKRVGREAFRLERVRLPAFDLILRLAKPVAAANTGARRQWRSEIDTLFGRLQAVAAKESRA